MKRAQRKDLLREIKRSFSRYLSIMLIMALGVAFYAGVRSAEPDMSLTVNTLYEDTDFMDIWTVGTLGLTDDDVAAISQVDGVDRIEGVYQTEAMSYSNDASYAMHVFSLCEDMNRLTIEEGRLPEAPDECFIDSWLANFDAYQLGDTITLTSGTDDDILDTLSDSTYKIVGIGTYSYYLSWDRGTIGIGSGKADAFIVLPKSAFKLDCYTAIYIKSDLTAGLNCHSDEYEDIVEDICDRIELLEDERCQARFDEVYSEADEKITDAKLQLEDAKEEFADAKQKLADAEAEFADGEQEVIDGEKELADGEKEIADGEREIDENRVKLDDAKAELLDAEKEIADGEEEIADAWKKIEKNEKKLEKAKKKIEDSEKELNENRAVLEESKARLEAAAANFEGFDYWPETMKQQYAEAKAEFDANTLAVEQGFLQLEAGEAELAEAKAEVKSGEEELEKGRKELRENEKKLEDAKAEYLDGLNEWKDGLSELTDAEEKLKDAKIELEDGRRELEDGRRDLEDGRVKLEDAKKEMADAEVTYDREVADAEEKIADAEEKLGDLEVPEWYVLDRNSIQTYAEYKQDSERIGAIGKVFPAIFYLVAALVSLTTMTRMIEEERTGIGTMKALGYGKLSIMSKYLSYTISSTAVGCVIGVAGGSIILPLVIIDAYKILYNSLPDPVIPIQWDISLAASGIAIGTTILVTIFTCYVELMAVPAELMRPEAPKDGKRVFLERIGFIWKKLSFSGKSTVRNLFRYKKRFFMTIFGIGGTMALLLVGFGLRDSIQDIVTKQYNTIWTYDAYMAIDSDPGYEENVRNARTLMAEEPDIYDYMLVGNTLTDVCADAAEDGVTKAAYIFVPEDIEKTVDYLSLQDRVSGEKYEFPKEGAVISEKLGKMLEIGIGDTLVIKKSEAERYEVVVSTISENYLYYYVYLSPDYYRTVFGEEPEFNELFIQMNEDLDDSTRSALAGRLLSHDWIDAYTNVITLENKVADMMHALDLVIWVLIISAALLAFIVLFNLNNINIIERRRELATLKLLGFYDPEVAIYVYRENVWLSIFGIAAGCILGRYLHAFIIGTCEIDMIMFGRDIKPVSYLISVVLTLVFAAAVNLFMLIKLKKIDMVESLKSVE